MKKHEGHIPYDSIYLALTKLHRWRIDEWLPGVRDGHNYKGKH